MNPSKDNNTPIQKASSNIQKVLKQKHVRHNLLTG